MTFIFLSFFLGIIAGVLFAILITMLVRDVTKELDAPKTEKKSDSSPKKMATIISLEEPLKDISQ